MISGGTVGDPGEMGISVPRRQALLAKRRDRRMSTMGPDKGRLWATEH